MKGKTYSVSEIFFLNLCVGLTYFNQKSNKFSLLFTKEY